MNQLQRKNTLLNGSSIWNPSFSPLGICKGCDYLITWMFNWIFVLKSAWTFLKEKKKDHASQMIQRIGL